MKIKRLLQKPLPLKTKGAFIRKPEKMVNQFNSGIKSMKKSWALERLGKSDAHLTWGILYFCSSEKAHKDGNHLLFKVGMYYSLFHVVFSLISLDPTVPDEELVHIKHARLISHLDRLKQKKITTSLFIKIFITMKMGREGLSYLVGEDVSTKFDLTKHPPPLKIYLAGKRGKEIELSFSEWMLLDIAIMPMILYEILFTVKALEDLLNKEVFFYRFNSLDFLRNFSSFKKNYIDNFLDLKRGDVTFFKSISNLILRYHEAKEFSKKVRL